MPHDPVGVLELPQREGGAGRQQRRDNLPLNQVENDLPLIFERHTKRRRSLITFSTWEDIPC